MESSSTINLLLHSHTLCMMLASTGAHLYVLVAVGGSQEEGAAGAPARPAGPGAAAGGRGPVHRQHCRQCSSHPVQVSPAAGTIKGKEK